MGRVTGIGGLFFRTRDPAALKDWYARHLGIAPPPGADPGHPWAQDAGPTVFEPFPADSTYFDAARPFMLNLRVEGLDALVADLRAAGIEVRQDTETHPYGRFAWLADPEGTPIELWEPPAG
jgi:catechol 2,3-dioxygenase-like lactoylglutathione lyase family enzyme